MVFGKSEHSVVFPYFGGKVNGVSILSRMLASGLKHIYILSYQRNSQQPYFMKFFSYKWVLNFIKWVFCPHFCSGNYIFSLLTTKNYTIKLLNLDFQIICIGLSTFLLLRTFKNSLSIDSYFLFFIIYIVWSWISLYFLVKFTRGKFYDYFMFYNFF